MPLRWWTVLPLARNPDPTDVCSICGHVRFLHVNQWPKGWSCSAACGCSCGPLAVPFHVAGLPANTIRDTTTENGRTRSVDQPAPPGKPING